MSKCLPTTVNGQIVEINGMDVKVPFGGAGRFAAMLRELKNLLGQVKIIIERGSEK